MKQSRFTDSQIMAILKQAEAGTPVPQLCREHGMSSASFYKWRAKYGGMDTSMMARLKELETENRQLKKMYAEERLKAEMVQEALRKKCERHLDAKRGRGVRLSALNPASAWPARRLASAKAPTIIRPNTPMKTRSSPTG